MLSLYVQSMTKFQLKILSVTGVVGGLVKEDM